MTRLSLWLAAMAATLGACAVPHAPGAFLDGASCDGCAEVAVDAATDTSDAGAPDDSTPDVPIATDTADVPDVSIVTDASDVPVDTTTPDVPIVMDAPDVPIVMDAPDVPIVMDAPDVPIVADVAEAGVDAACLSGDLTLCAGVGCVNTQTNAEHCGRCGAACPAGHGCVAGVCVARCSGVVCASACVDLQSDPSNCGACAMRCPSPPFATSTCAGGRCALSCAAGRADCDGDALDGCEVDINANVAHCGGCGRPCPERPNTAPRCTVGRCESACLAGFGDCDGDAASGCEAELATNPLHCGACGRACARSESCVDGRCTCGPGLTACPGGCVDARNDLANCGGCGVRCAAGQVCAAGRCTTDCGALTLCSGTCFDVTGSAQHCGACGNACPARPNATPTCAASRCGSACLPGFDDCDGDAANGCESDLATSVLHCGACGRACRAGPHATATCAARACRLTCEVGWGDCNGDPSDGCEVDLRAPASCGACGNACPARLNATATCASGACGVACLSGYGNCDGADGNGCEVDLSGSASHCGRCGNACPSGRVCTLGACACPAGTTACGASCVDVSSDLAHCGACGNACAVGEFCAAGVCRPSCTQTVCGGACVDTNTSLGHCGTCGNACPARPNATASCAAGRCGFLCVEGFGDCNGNAADGCEVDLRASPSHCGACGMACAAAAHVDASCALGSCASRCATGWGDCNGNGADGCEANLATTVAHCGRCGNACPARPNADAACAASACGITCRSGYGDCDGADANGCEVDLRTSNASCGACGNACTGGRTCVAGACTCPSGTSLCGGVCVDRSSDRANCGACGVACATSQWCLAGVCVTDCGTLTLCGSACADLANSANNCGACGTVCATRPASSPICASSRCDIVCAAGYGNCNGSTTDGCEVTLSTSLSHCGACGNACPARANASALCSGGACGFVCNAGFADCNASAADGCEVSTTTVTNCGACGTACPTRANADPSCTAGTCGVVCRSGYGNCDGFDSNGCEATLATSAAHCGACGRACAAGQACVGGACTTVSAPRAVAPMTTTTVLSARPYLRWDLPTGVTSAWLRICTTRLCSTLVTPEFMVTGAATTSPVTLPNGRYFWQMQGVQNGVRGTAWSPVWSFAVESVNTSGNNRGTARTYVDVQGTGNADLLVGASGASSVGRAYLYAGSSSGLASSPTTTLSGGASSVDFGYSVASAGDVNGDGYGDVVVGDPSASASAGAVYVFLGMATGLSTAAATTFTGPAGSRFGYSVAGVGDVNGDGYGDILIGAYGADVTTGGNEGRAFLYRGSAAGVVPAVYRTLNGYAANDRFGVSVAAAGDVNADGYADVVVGADEATPAAAAHAGAAYIYLGRSDTSGGLIAAPSDILGGQGAGDDFGISVASAGDVDGDGYADVIVGADDADVSTGDNAGKAYVFRGGGAGVSATPYRTLNGTGTGSLFGGSVAGAGDIDGNGYGDVLVGSAGASTGVVNVYTSGAAGLSTSPQRVLAGGSTSGAFGGSVAGIGYFGTSGYPAIAIGDRTADPTTGTNAGSVTVFVGSATGIPTTAYRTLNGSAAAEYFGTSVARAPQRRPQRDTSRWCAWSALPDGAWRRRRGS